ncbi:hypothetical protein C8Q70DRAFT_578268 [Cubamyces menziesii]|nr:hypothetical protein C8Q70DRAFT_578268 [Cubamyces menziesii]
MFTLFMQAVTSLVLAIAASTALAKPVQLTTRDDVLPPITNPTAQTVWRVGETQTVTWDVAALNGAPPSNPTAKIILGTLTSDGDEHLMLESPLASDFPILGGNVSLTVPSVPDGNNYIVCLFGSTGDISPMFTITGGNSSSSAPSSALSSSTAASTSASVSASPSTLSHANTPTASQSATPNTAATSSAASSTPITPASTLNNPSSSFSGSVGSGNIAAGNATATGASNSSSPTQTPGTSAAELGPRIHAHLWGACCALVE